MKNSFLTLVLLALTATTLQAQIKKPVLKLPNDRNINLSLNGNLNMEIIKNHINSGKYCYNLYLSTTVIIPPKNGKHLKEIIGYFGGGKYVKTERNYLRVNDVLLRSDKRYNRSQGDNYEVLIYPERSNPKNIDKNQVKLTWRSPERGLKTFHLKHVSIQYKPYGIIITGDYELDGMIFGVSISLAPGTCLI